MTISLKKIFLEMENYDKPAMEVLGAVRNAGQKELDPRQLQILQQAAETTSNPKIRKALFQLNSMGVFKALTYNPHLTPAEKQALRGLGDPEVSYMLGENVTDVSGEQMMSKVDDKIGEIADLLARNVPAHELVNMLIQHYQMNQEKAEGLIRQAEQLLHSGY